MDIVFYQFALDLQKDNWRLQIIKKNKIQFLFIWNRTMQIHLSSFISHPLLSFSFCNLYPWFKESFFARIKAINSWIIHEGTWVHFRVLKLSIVR